MITRAIARLAPPLFLVAASLVLLQQLPWPARGPASASAVGAYSVVVPLVARDPEFTPAGPVPYPAGTRTGVTAVDAALAALEAGAPAALEALFELTPAPCVVNPQGITNPPLCPEGVAAGTLVPVFRATACESVWPDYLDTALESLWRWPRPLLAIYRDPTDAYSWLPAADYAIVVQWGPSGEGWPAVIRVAGDRVNGIAFGCGGSFDQLTAGVETSRFLLPPQR